jgi:hypothetical protein
MLAAFRQPRLPCRTTRGDGRPGPCERPVTRAPYVGTLPGDPGEATTELKPMKEIVGTTENRLSAPPAPYTLPPEGWTSRQRPEMAS